MMKKATAAGGPSRKAFAPTTGEYFDLHLKLGKSYFRQINSSRRRQEEERQWQVQGGDEEGLGEDAEEPSSAEGEAKLWRLAEKEFREAKRLRPRDETATTLAREAQRGRYAALAVSRPVVSEVERLCKAFITRVLAYFNLSVRYWDEGKAEWARQQAQLACDLLRDRGLPEGCARHNLTVIHRLTNHHREEEKDLTARMARKQKSFTEELSLYYHLAVLFFDKRMLYQADRHLTATRTQLGVLNALCHCRKEPPPEVFGLPSRPPGGPRQTSIADRAVEETLPKRLREAFLAEQREAAFETLSADLRSVEDDLLFVQELQEIFTIELPLLFTQPPHSDLLPKRTPLPIADEAESAAAQEADGGFHREDAIERSMVLEERGPWEDCRALPCLMARFERTPGQVCECDEWRRMLATLQPHPDVLHDLARNLKRYTK
ncbi:unnamed protein product [Vitrella brassicaformis CCMP3155]|uniref:Uncharacterized protein n=1 Tax=Vitrella brassicaformis (strain CCMP3155) TaxID=1169540 RepID=A0A0G4FJY1_VITBC|nr:unnamed protein product [Vitrella brassicaformis CCMP3155]|eukprot:CEM13701.1 unnamed protein product [Vitrella brassicaformis CCMP3155]